MNVKSMFEYKFPASAREEGLSLIKSIGEDMTKKDGYLSFEIIQDVTDAGHIMGNTLWKTREQSNAVLSVYQNDDKIKRATELMGHSPTGYVGDVVGSSS